MNNQLDYEFLTVGSIVVGMVMSFGGARMMKIVFNPPSWSSRSMKVGAIAITLIGICFLLLSAFFAWKSRNP